MTRAELAAAGFKVGEAAYARLARFAGALLAENQQVNLTGAASEAEIWHVHVCDSLALLRALPPAPSIRLLDLGSGGGLPGLPLACVLDGLDVTLLDATKKKVAALARMIGRLGLTNARALWGRAETLAHEAAFREQFDLVTARAVAALPVLLEYAAGFARPGGHCWFFKSAAGAAAEIAQATVAAAACNLVAVEPLSYRLPGEPDERVLVGYRKHAPLPAHLPRPPGRAKKRPL